MFIQNAMFFMLWVVFFAAIHDVRGWHLDDLCLFWSVSCISIGLAFFLCDGARTLGRQIVTGELDTHLLRPRHPLPSLITSRCNPSSLGDIAFGLLLALGFAHAGPLGATLILLIACLAAILFVSLTVSLQCLAFFIRGGDELADELLMATICLGSVPQHTAGVAVKLVLFTALPAGFISIVPVSLVRHGEAWLLPAMIAAVATHVALACFVFSRGLRRYTSAAGAFG